MEFQKIAEEAYRGNGINDSWNLPTKYAYMRLEILYNKYTMGNISKEASIIEKAKIEKEFEGNKSEYNKVLEINREYNQNRADNTMLLIQVEKSNSKEEMVEPLLRIVGKCVKDDSFADRNLEKIVEYTLN